MSDFTRGLPLLARAARHPLPEEDEMIDALAPEMRLRIAESWLKRAEAELGAGGVFAAIARGLFLADMPMELVWLASRAISDEIRHGELCRYAYARYAGVEPPRASPVKTREARGGALVLAAVHAAINESIATVYLSASLEAADAPFANALLRELLTDEVDHARVGWGILADPSQQSGEARAEVQKHLPALIGMVRTMWRDAARSASTDLPREHGWLAGPEIAKLIDQALRDLVFPGLAHVGIDPGRAAHLLEE